MQSPPAEPRVERRIVTVLFADLVGFTSLSEALDPEDVATVQDAYFASVRETVGRWGGRLEKFIGDAAMATFGAQRARDDDARRAVQAGLALVHAVEQIGAQLGLEEGALRLRVGINTGEAVTATSGEDEGRVTGDTVNTAARLQTAAPPGRVLIGQNTSLAVADIASLERVEPLQLKGKADPVPAWLVVGFRPQASRDEAMGALHAPTLGRDEELNRLLEAHQRSQSGAVERWLVIAPPGVGKSRLLRELGERIATADPATAVVRMRARPDSLSPFDPIAQLLLDALHGAGLPTDLLDTDMRAGAAQILRDRLAAVGAIPARVAVVTETALSIVAPSATSESAAQPQERDELFSALLEALDSLAGNAAVVWLAEDVHWAGGDVLSFLDLAGSAHRANGGGRLVVATARPSLLESEPDWSRADPDDVRHVIQLPTLAATDANGLVKALVGNALPQDLVERIVERSDGNCLFIEELLRAWVSVGTLVHDGGAWLLAVPAEDVTLPASVQQIYAAQIDDLPTDARLVARRASVAGRRFAVAALEPLGASSKEGLDPLRRRELVTGPQPEPILGDAYAYRHALLRDAGYASLARAERARLHILLARWLEQAAGPRSGELAEQIAGNYSAALDSAPALAREVGDGVDRQTAQRLAADWYERAGQTTLAGSAHDAARELFRRSIDLTPAQSLLEQARRWEHLGDATAFAADMDEGGRAYEKAMELYRQAMADASAGIQRGSDELQAGLAEARNDLQDAKADLKELKAGLARATAGLSDVMYQQLKFGEERDLADGVINELGSTDPASLARLLVARAMGALGARGPSPKVETDMVCAVELAHEAGDVRTELRAEEALTTLRHERGRGDASDWKRIGEAALRLGDWGTAVGSLINSAMTLLENRPRDVPAATQEARETALAHGRTEDSGWADYVAAEAAFVSGDWARAVEVGTRAVDLGEANAYLRLTVRTWHILIPIASVTGGRPILERAARWYRGLEGKFEFPDSPYARVIRPAQNLDFAAAGLWPADVPEVEPRVAAFGEAASGGSWCAALDRVFRGWLEAGELDGAERAVDALAQSLVRDPKPAALRAGTYELMRGRLALARGDPKAATHAARAALGHFRTTEAPWWIGKAIRLLERADAADYQLLAEVFAIEQALAATAPTD